jgi:hypothetical protein
MAASAEMSAATIGGAGAVEGSVAAAATQRDAPIRQSQRARRFRFVPDGKNTIHPPGLLKCGSSKNWPPDRARSNATMEIQRVNKYCERSSAAAPRAKCREKVTGPPKKIGHGNRRISLSCPTHAATDHCKRRISTRSI